MPSLLSIPQELRDNIIELVLSSARLAPPTISSAETTRCTPATSGESGSPDSGFMSWPYGPSHVWLEKSVYRSNSYPLSLTNHQLADETAAALRRLSLLSLRYELDVMIANERDLLPTWLSVPVLATKLDVVNVTFRAMGLEDEHKRSAWKSGCTGPPVIMWCFYYLLEHVLKRGPVGQTSSSRDREVSIKVLDLDFVGNNDYPTGEGTRDELRDPYSNYFKYAHSAGPHETKKTKSLRPEWLADYLDADIWNLLSMGSSTADYGKILHERIVTIRFRVNGKIKGSLDIAHILHGLNPETPNHTFGRLPHNERLPALWKWKEETTRKRMELGFPGVDDDEEEKE
ncbi:hypothetical protein BU16DRAFT_615311 [Lophium mytilinum]|uniref:F-box domain-containing protein n=1 Tax=Lophium mytilinum TaxID=390894 RepID=A0A6A6R158_9PEZI|nr:hypothetical protein BU16DRAFT_615311 [Lophium mytilinum]